MILCKAWNTFTAVFTAFLFMYLFYLHKVKLKPHSSGNASERRQLLLQHLLSPTLNDDDTQREHAQIARRLNATITTLPTTTTNSSKRRLPSRDVRQQKPANTADSKRAQPQHVHAVGLSLMFKRTERVQVFRDLCLEKTGNETQLVVYNAAENGIKHIDTTNGRSVFQVAWPVHFRNSKIPKSHRLLNAHAYLMNNAYYGNLHHIFSDALEALYRAFQVTRDWTAANEMTRDHDIYFLAHTYDYKTRRNVTRLDKSRRDLSYVFYKAMGVSYYDTYVSLPQNTCFRKAVFTHIIRPQGVNDLESILKDTMGIDDATCRHIHRPRVVIQLRHYRTITNGNELQRSLEREFNASVIQVRHRRCVILRKH